MKKLVFGCLGVFVVLAVVGGILGYVYIVEPARKYLAAFQQLGQLSALDKEVRNTKAFTPPAHGELTADMVKRFAAVQDAMQAQLGGRFKQLHARYRQLSREIEAGTRRTDARTVFNALEDLSGVLTEAKRIQVDLLNRMGFSVAEYEWVRDRVYRAAGMAVAGLDFKAIWDAAREGTFDLETKRPAAPSGAKLAKPRLALYRPWTASMDEGWTRWLFEMYGFDFTSVYNADVQAGALRDRFDVLILTDERARSITDGFQNGSVPPRYEGGIGDRGVRAIEEFVRRGGTLVCLNNSSLFAIDALRLPVKNVLAGVNRQQFFASGPILEIIADAAHPVMAGVPDRAKVFVSGSPVFSTTKEFEGTVLAKYQASGSPLVSGYLLGEKFVNGYAAAIDARYGDGHVVLIGFKPQWRGQPFGTFKVLFNAALFHGELAAKASGTKGFWSTPAEPEKKEPEKR